MKMTIDVSDLKRDELTLPKSRGCKGEVSGWGGATILLLQVFGNPSRLVPTRRQKNLKLCYQQRNKLGQNKQFQSSNVIIRVNFRYSVLI